MVYLVMVVQVGLVCLSGFHLLKVGSDAVSGTTITHDALCNELARQPFKSRYSAGGTRMEYTTPDGARRVEIQRAQGPDFWEEGFGLRIMQSCDEAEERFTLETWPSTGLIADVVPSDN